MEWVREGKWRCGSSAVSARSPTWKVPPGSPGPDARGLPRNTSTVCISVRSSAQGPGGLSCSYITGLVRARSLSEHQEMGCVICFCSVRHPAVCKQHTVHVEHKPTLDCNYQPTVCIHRAPVAAVHKRRTIMWVMPLFKRYRLPPSCLSSLQSLVVHMDLAVEVSLL